MTDQPKPPRRRPTRTATDAPTESKAAPVQEKALTEGKARVAPKPRKPAAQAEAPAASKAPAKGKPPTAKPKPAETKQRPAKAAPAEPVREQLDLLAVPPPSAPAPLPEPAARYPRRAPPPAQDQPVRETLSMADRARRMGQHHRPAETAATERPKPLDMGEIAARNRMARHAVRDERLPEPVAPAPPKVEPGPSMAERAARHSLVHRVDDKPQVAAPVAPPIAASVPVPADDDVSMAERAAEAVRRRRDAHGPAQVAPPVEPQRAGSRAASSSTAVVLVCRNHARFLVDRVKAWQRLLDAIDTRWLVLDLGSTDDSVDQAEAAHVQVLRRPGGLVTPLATVDVAVRQAGADVVLLIDAAAEPHPAIIELAGVVRAGHAAAVAPERHPIALAVARQAWLEAGRGTDLDVATRARRLGGLRRRSGGGAQPKGDGLIARAVQVPAWQGWLQRARSLVRTVRKVLKR